MEPFTRRDEKEIEAVKTAQAEALGPLSIPEGDDGFHGQFAVTDLATLYVDKQT